jgi:predicted RecB family nuclease
MTVLLPAEAAGSCPLKTYHRFDSSAVAVVRPRDLGTAQREQQRLAFRTAVLDLVVDGSAGSVADLRPLLAAPERSAAASVAAMEAGVALVVQGWLPDDVSGQRSGFPDLLVRGRDRPNGRHRYHPVDIRWHKVLERPRPDRDQAEGAVRPTPALGYTTISSPRPQGARELVGHRFRWSSREGDLLQLAHYHRMLQTAGFGEEPPGVAGDDSPVVGVIGTDAALPEPYLVWVDLSVPVLRTFSRSHADGWRWRSVLDRYDHAHAARLKLAEAAAHPGPRPVTGPPAPVVVVECLTCRWWQQCRPRLDDDDISLRIDKSPLDRCEITALRRLGVATVTELAAADLPALLVAYLPEVTYRSNAETRLLSAARRARMLVAGAFLERETTGCIDVPTAEVEVDLDIETSTDGRVYLWGFLVTDTVTGVQVCRQFGHFDNLDAAAERRLAVEALTWLQGCGDGGRSVLVYHYSAYEVMALSRLLADEPNPTLEWAAGFARSSFVDLWEVVRDNFFGVAGLGLKVVARQGAGFSWRDSDPGGLNSQQWFHDAVHADSAESRALAKQRVLDYNEDDVRATAAVRVWLRAQ